MIIPGGQRDFDKYGRQKRYFSPLTWNSAFLSNNPIQSKIIHLEQPYHNMKCLFSQVLSQIQYNK